MTKKKNFGGHLGGRPRAASGTPQKTNTRADNVDLTKTDPWAYQARMAERLHSNDPASSILKPTPLSPAFSSNPASHSTTTISAPQDPRQNPVWIAQQMAVSRNNAFRRPSFFSAVNMPGDKSDSAGHDGTPTPEAREDKDRSTKKSKKDDNKAKSTKTPVNHDPVEEAKRQEKKKRVKAEMKQQTARAIEGMQAAAANDSRKRKRNTEEAVAVNHAFDDDYYRLVQIEALAVKRLRDLIPASNLTRTALALEHHHGEKPTDMAVLLTAARDTILGLGSKELVRMEQVLSFIDSDMIRIVKTQEARLSILEGKAEGRDTAPTAFIVSSELSTERADDTSTAGSDDSDDEEDETPTATLPSAKPEKTVAEAMKDEASSSSASSDDSDEDSDDEEDDEEVSVQTEAG